MLRARKLTAFLDRRLQADRYPGDRNGLLHPGAGAVTRLGLALEPRPGLVEWAGSQRLDALLLHRAWGLDPSLPAAGVVILAYHLPFDDHLTLGHNPLLAAALGIEGVERFAERDGRWLGMIGSWRGTFGELLDRVRREFGEPESVEPPLGDPPGRVAVVGAMTDALVRESVARGVGAYLTGQRRAPADRALRATGVGLIAAGHAASERWGLGALAGLLRERFPLLEVVVHPADRPPGQKA